MREVVDLLKANNELKIIKEPLDVNLEIPHLAYLEVKKKNSKALLFTNPINREKNIQYDAPVLMNLFGSYNRVQLLIGDIDRISKDIQYLIKLQPPKNLSDIFTMLPRLLRLRFLSPKLVDCGLAQEAVKIGNDINLYEIPILKTWEHDGGPFITMGQCYTQSLNGKVKNLGMYRLQVYSKDRLGLHWQIHKDSIEILEEYRKAGKKMPVSIAIGGDALYTWCATAPMPYGIFELMLYGFIRNKRAKMVRCVSNELSVPYDSDYVIEGFVSDEFMDEGRFGDHTGFYTPIEPYPVLEVTAITHKKNPIYLATVVGKPPLEDKYLGYPTERIFLPLLQTTTPNLIDYYMPENGVFHNLILAKIKARFPSAAKQAMHSFWGVGQMSFVKHAIFVDENAPELNSIEIVPYILDRFKVDNCLFSEGVCDALDHASPNFAEGGKLGIDCTVASNNGSKLEILDNDKLCNALKEVFDGVEMVRQYYCETRNPISLVGLNKNRCIWDDFKSDKLIDLLNNVRIVVLLDCKTNDLENLYMILWRVVNNIDSKRDIKIFNKIIVIDATNKDKSDGYIREWPLETDCSLDVLENLEKKGLIDDIDDISSFYRMFHIDNSYSTNT